MVNIIAIISVGAILGYIGGLITASMGAYKDTKWEPFELKKFLRSPILGAVGGASGILLYPSVPLELIMIFAMFIERITVETWKGLIRKKKPSKFDSPHRDTGWMK